MAHNLHIGQKFEDFAVFESAIMRYQNAENVQFYRRDSRSVDKAQPRLEKKLNPKIKYHEQGRTQRWCCRGHWNRAAKAAKGGRGEYERGVNPLS